MGSHWAVTHSGSLLVSEKPTCCLDGNGCEVDAVVAAATAVVAVTDVHHASHHHHHRHHWVLEDCHEVVDAEELRMDTLDKCPA